MPNRIAPLLGLRPVADGAEIVRRDQLGRAMGVSQSEALRLTRRPDFPEPILALHRREPGETLPQPQPVWQRVDLERWVKQQTAVR
jgi:hypothetical protein